MQFVYRVNARPSARVAGEALAQRLALLALHEMPGYNHAMNAPGPTRPERGNPYPSGGPAIQPRITAADASTAAYTEADVRQYLATHPAFPTVDGTEPVIAKVLFIPASEASALMRGASIGRPDTTLVCYVEVHGNLSTSWVHVPKPGVYPATARVGVLVFDAQTGNALICGLTG